MKYIIGWKCVFFVSADLIQTKAIGPENVMEWRRLKLKIQSLCFCFWLFCKKCSECVMILYFSGIFPGKLNLLSHKRCFLVLFVFGESCKKCKICKILLKFHYSWRLWSLMINIVSYLNLVSKIFCQGYVTLLKIIYKSNFS